ncbi:hypothetical protein [Oligoflexus tunisiensis]|uniref:hypothetical protein n=1 Tax=Oligoflexus tunisiensis TaxID=708132 RepID=UPI001C4016F7|nr:hypothetical protein [Oligoflexus tunisiensis]
MTSLPLIAWLMCTPLKAEDQQLVWYQNVVADGAIHEIGRGWWNEYTTTFQSTNEFVEWRSQCHWDSPRNPPYEMGNNFMSYSVVELGNREVGTTAVKYPTRPGAGQKRDTLDFSNAFQTLTELQGYFPNKTGTVQIHVRGTTDRCENPAGPSITPQRTVSLYIQYRLTCSSNDTGSWVHTQHIWREPSNINFPVVENLPIEQTSYINIDISKCDGPLFISARVLPAEKLTINWWNISLWAD